MSYVYKMHQESLPYLTIYMVNILQIQQLKVNNFFNKNLISAMFMRFKKNPFYFANQMAD